MLNMEGLGFSRSEITKELTGLFGCTPRTVQYDFKNRGYWQPLIEKLDPQTSLLKIINRLNMIYRKACFKLLQSQNEMVQLGALRIMLESSKALREVTVPTEQQVLDFDLDAIVASWKQGKDISLFREKCKDLLASTKRYYREYNWEQVTPEEQKTLDKHTEFYREFVAPIYKRIKVSKDNPPTPIH